MVLIVFIKNIFRYKQFLKFFFKFFEKKENTNINNNFNIELYNQI